MEEKYNTLSKSEKMVAEWVKQNAEKCVYMSMAVVANSVGVSEPSVLRFCRKIGFKGFTDFRINLIQSLSGSIKLIHNDISEYDTIGNMVKKVFQSQINSLQDTLLNIDYSDIEKAANLIRNSDRIIIIGVGTSGPVVQTSYNLFFRLGYNLCALTDSYLQLMEAALIKSDDLVIGISQSGNSLDPILTMERAKRNGANTICITGEKDSPITKYADIIFLSKSRETRPETIDARLSQFAIVNALYVTVSMLEKEKAFKNEKIIYEAIVPKLF